MLVHRCLSLFLALGMVQAMEFMGAASWEQGFMGFQPPSAHAPKPQSQAGNDMMDLGECLGLFMCQKGDGKNFPKTGDTLKLHYIGKLSADDSKFDSSRDRGTPFSFTIGEGAVIQGWEEGIAKMSLGERAILQIPAAKAYGENGAGGKIPPNADLYFDVELLAINGRDSKPDDKDKLPEQGYSGKKVQHKNMETCTDDWRTEYGPKAGKGGSCSKKKEKKVEKTTAEPKPVKKSGVDRLTISSAAIVVALCGALTFA